MESNPCSKKITNEEFSALATFLSKNQFSSNEFTKVANYSIDFKSNNASFNKTYEYFWPKLLNFTEEKAEEINKEKTELQKTCKILENFVLRSNVDVNDKFETISDVSKVFGDDDEKFSIEHQPGQALLVDFWATWCGPCQGPMKHNQDMLEKHAADWGNKVRIVGLSLDDQKDAVVKRVNERNWKLVDHFFLGGWNAEHNALKNYQFDGIPFVVLVDTQGVVVYTGHPSSIDLESKFDSMVKSSVEGEKKQEKTDFKTFSSILSKKFVETLNSEGLKETNCSLNITWKKETTYNANGQIVKFKYTHPQFSLNYHVKNESAANKLQESLFSLLDKSLFTIKVTVDNPKEAFKFCSETLKTQLNIAGLQEAEIKFKKSQCFEWESGEFVNEKSKTFVQENSLKPNKLEQVQNFNQSLRKAIEAANDPKKTFLLARFALTAKLSVGDDFFDFEVQDVFSENKVVLKHEENEVLLVDFWATWCGPCQGPMAHNQEMLEKNSEKWGGKVRIVGVSLDQSKEDVVNRVNTKNWKSVVHYFLGDNKKGIEPYGVRGIPDVCLVDQKGKIVYKGHPAGCGLEEKINELLEGKTVEKVEEKKEEKKEETSLKPFKKEDKKNLVKFLKDPKIAQELKEALKTICYNVKFCVDINNTVTFDGEMNLKEEPASENPVVSLELRQSDLNKINPFLSKLYEVVAADKLKEDKKLIETVSFAWGTECSGCKKKLKPLDSQYYCHFCKLWFCIECGDNVDESKQGNDRLLHPHNMVLINIIKEEGLNDIDVYKLGENVMYKENCQGFGACCNGCSGSVGPGYRYICLSCRPGPRRPGGFIDLCNQCVETLKKKGQENGEEYGKIKKNLEENDGHEVDSHLLLRICYGNNYYKY